MWGLQETLNSMFSYQLWDIGTKLATVGAATGGAVWAYFKYQDEKRRQYYEKRLTSVYGPLIGLLTACVTLESMDYVNDDGKIKLVVPANWGDIKGLGEFRYGSKNLDKLLEGEDFLLKIEDHIGYARPNLVELYYKYKFLLQIKKIVDDEQKRKQREEVKLKLLNEIAEGYQDTKKKLGIE